MQLYVITLYNFWMLPNFFECTLLGHPVLTDRCKQIASAVNKLSIFHHLKLDYLDSIQATQYTNFVLYSSVRLPTRNRLIFKLCKITVWRTSLKTLFVRDLRINIRHGFAWILRLSYLQVTNVNKYTRFYLIKSDKRIML